ncbi:MAG: recombination mediator RecR [Bacteroidetes bacterium]|nr:recombination mediator RecR [Bacteroidota bacterium]
MQPYPSKLLEQAVNEISRLPGIGRKTALRMALHLLRRDTSEVEALGQAVIRMRKEVIYCNRCKNISDNDVCSICANLKRDQFTVCVVEDIRDVMAVENTNQFGGVYHVLGGIISPMDGVGPQDLSIDSLLDRIEMENITEVILALPTTIEGDTTNFYIARRLNRFSVKITTIARGISIGDELEYADEVTLGRSILNRTPYNVSI